MDDVVKHNELTTNKGSKGLDIVIHVYTLNVKLTAQGFRLNSVPKNKIKSIGLEKMSESLRS